MSEEVRQWIAGLSRSNSKHSSPVYSEQASLLVCPPPFHCKWLTWQGSCETWSFFFSFFITWDVNYARLVVRQQSERFYHVKGERERVEHVMRSRKEDKNKLSAKTFLLMSEVDMYMRKQKCRNGGGVRVVLQGNPGCSQTCQSVWNHFRFKAV